MPGPIEHWLKIASHISQSGGHLSEWPIRVNISQLVADHGLAVAHEPLISPSVALELAGRFPQVLETEATKARVVPLHPVEQASPDVRDALAVQEMARPRDHHSGPVGGLHVPSLRPEPPHRGNRFRPQGELAVDHVFPPDPPDDRFVSVDLIMAQGADLRLGKSAVEAKQDQQPQPLLSNHGLSDGTSINGAGGN
jgi:hypothetical protein